MNRPSLSRALALALVACLAAPVPLVAQVVSCQGLICAPPTPATVDVSSQLNSVLVLGSAAKAVNNSAGTVIGNWATLDNSGGTVVGYSASLINSPAGTAVGDMASVKNAMGTAIGTAAYVTLLGHSTSGFSGTVLGRGGQVTGDMGIGIGDSAVSGGDRDIVIGTGAISGDISRTVASLSKANVVIGTQASAPYQAQQNVVLGDHASVGNATRNSVSLGANTTTREDNVVAVGARRITQVADAIVLDNAATLNQLQKPVASLGGGASFIEGTGTYKAPTYALSSGTYHDVGSALTALDEKPTGGAGSAVWLSSNDTTTPATSTGPRSTTVGAGGVTPATNTVTLGNGSAGTEDNTVSVGSDGSLTPFLQRRLVNVADGINPSDAVTMRQAENITATFGGGASLYANLAPTYVFTSPGSAGTYNDVGTALGALDRGLTAVNERVDTITTGDGGSAGPAGPQGPKGDKGDAGPQGPAGSGTGNGRDDLAVHYDDATQTSASLGGSGGTTVKNVRAGVAQTDAANVSQVQAAVQQSQTYTDTSVAAAKDWSKAYTDQRFNRASRQASQAGAVGSAIGMLALGAQGIEQRDRLVMSVAGYKGRSAVGIGFNHVSQSGRISTAVGGAFSSGGSAIGVSVGIGLGR